MLDSFFFLTTGWLMTVAANPTNDPQIAADLAILKNAAVKSDVPALLNLFKKRTLLDRDRETVHACIRRLGSETYRLREQAMGELIRRGPAIVPMLREATKDTDLEIARRSEQCLARIQDRDVPVNVLPAAARLLTARKPAGAVDIMLAYVPYADNDKTLDEARVFLTLLAKEDNKSRPALVAGLSNALPARRAAAGEALCRAGLEDTKANIRNLLADPDAFVRMRVALALAYAGEKDAVPVLIDTLPRLTLVQAWQAEDLLLRLAEDRSPPTVAVGTDETTRGKCRDAWQAWWKEHATTANLARLRETPQPYGYTLVVLLDIGQILELGPTNQTRWRIDNLIFPLDVQVLPGDRVLVAEYYGKRVTERNFKGQVLWEKEIAGPTGPLMAQRLPGGNTFIATEHQAIEIDRAGKEIFSFSLTRDERIMKAIKLANGEIACLTTDSRVVRFDTAGKEIHSYPVSLGKQLFGGRIYMLSGGSVLIPHYAENKVVEYDAVGKAVWEITVDEPVAAVRLPNGNTLVTTMNPQRGAVEFDRNGHEVWTYRSTSRVTRALRR
jgi:HEAT repeat protein